MRIEERLTRALAEEAERVDVDVDALRHRTRQRLAGGARGRGAGSRPDRRAGARPLAAAAAVLLLVVGTGVVASRLRGDIGREEPAGPVTGGRVHDVATTFACPVHEPVDLSGAQDEFLPVLTEAGPEEVAREHEAPRWVFEVSGRRAELRLGNADGSLGSVATYRLDDGTWRLVAAEACTGAGSTAAPPTAGELRLGTHGVAPHPPRGVLRPDAVTGEPVLVDDRAFYDYSGLVTRHRSVYAAPCEDEKVCWRAGDPQGGVIGQRPMRSPDGEPKVQDVTDFVVLPDDLVGRSNPLGMWAVWDAVGGTTFAAVLRDGTRRPATRLSDPSWNGASLLVVLARRADVAQLRVR